jgi:hypothetical protein
MALEREAFAQTTPERRAELLKRLDEIEERVITGKLPGSIAGEVYVLREHIGFVRDRLNRDAPSKLDIPSPTDKVAAG